jgi:hypothetical protein
LRWGNFFPAWAPSRNASSLPREHVRPIQPSHAKEQREPFGRQCHCWKRRRASSHGGWEWGKVFWLFSQNASSMSSQVGFQHDDFSN